MHIKDRLLHGTTVPLGSGNANIPKVLKMLNSINYGGNYVLQTARATDTNHEGVLCEYRDQVIKWMEEVVGDGKLGYLNEEMPIAKNLRQHLV